MQIIYEITFNSKSQYIKNLITQLIVHNNINASCEQNSQYIYIITQDSQEKIEAFFKHLETALPLSVFMESSKIIDALPVGVAFLEPNLVQPILSLSNDEVVELITHNDAQKILNGEIIKIQTATGECYFAKASQENRVKLESYAPNINMFIANTHAFETLFSLNQKDVQLLCSIERPLVKLKLNYQANNQNQYSQTNTIYAKMPYDKATFLLAYEVKALGLDALIYCHTSLAYDAMKVGYVDKNIFIVEGNSGLFPKFDYDSSKTFKTSKEYFDFHGGVFKSVLTQFNKRTTACIGVYFTTVNNNSEIVIYTPNHGKKAIVSVPNIYLNLATNLEEISEIDENTPRLIENYKKKFPQLFENVNLVFKDSHGFESIINLIAYFLGIKNSTEFESLAFNFSAKSGINIDMKVLKIDGVNYLDYRRVVQSMMSYKLAGVPNDLLAFSFYESLSEFISNTVTQLKNEFECSEVILCGNMFANTTLIEKTYKALNKTFNVIIPKEYPLDYNE
jgi:hydrogenase maturation factor HypF (carbamoyltransferase family)